MKRAKQRPLPAMAKLVSSTKRASRSMTEALSSIAASNKRIAQKEKRRKTYRLHDLLDQMPDGWQMNDEMKAWEQMIPVGKEVL